MKFGCRQLTTSMMLFWGFGLANNSDENRARLARSLQRQIDRDVWNDELETISDEYARKRLNARPKQLKNTADDVSPMWDGVYSRGAYELSEGNSSWLGDEGLSGSDESTLQLDAE